MSDRFRDLSPAEQRIAALRRDGEDVIDRNGRPRVYLGDGPESQLVRAMYPMKEARPRKSSHAINVADFRNAYEAVASANLSGLVLNTFVTVSWRVGSISTDEEAAHQHRLFMERMKSWFGYERSIAESEFPAFSAVWVKEVGQTLGLHSHILVHVPPALEQNFRGWAIRAAHRLVDAPRFSPWERPGEARLIHISPNFHADAEQQWRIFRYLMKALDPEESTRALSDDRHMRLLMAEFAGVRPAYQGIVPGARTGRTTALGPKALAALRKQIGFVEIWPRNSLQGDQLAYDDYFLRHGKLARQLANTGT